MTDHALAFYGNRAARLPTQEERRLLLRRTFTWVLVALVHVVLLSLFVVSQYRETRLTLRHRELETILDLTKFPAMPAPPIRLIKPEVPTAREPAINTAPVIVVPPDDPNLAVPKTPGDILKAIGEALSCGAENYENLTQAERARCKREPWVAYKRPDGTIVLQANTQSPFAPPPVPKISGADAMRRQMQQGPACNIMLNIPCVQNTPMVGIGIPTN